MSARWEKEVVKQFTSGQYKKAANIIRSMRKGVSKHGKGSLLSVNGVLASKIGNRANNLSSQMTHGYERSLVAERKKPLFIKDKLR